MVSKMCQRTSPLGVLYLEQGLTPTGFSMCVVNVYSPFPVPGEEEKEESPPRRGSASMGVRKVRCGICCIRGT